LTSCYAAVCEEAAFPSSDPQSDQHMDLILGRDLLAPEVLLRVIRLFAINAGFFVLKPSWSVTSVLWAFILNSLHMVFLWTQKLKT